MGEARAKTARCGLSAEGEWKVPCLFLLYCIRTGSCKLWAGARPASRIRSAAPLCLPLPFTAAPVPLPSNPCPATDVQGRYGVGILREVPYLSGLRMKPVEYVPHFVPYASGCRCDSPPRLSAASLIIFPSTWEHYCVQDPG